MELTFQVLPGLCAGCGACLRTCPEHALRPGPAQYPGPAATAHLDASPATVEIHAGAGASVEFDADADAGVTAVSDISDVLASSGISGRAPVILAYLCTGCGECMEVCPVDAIEEVADSVVGKGPSRRPETHNGRHDFTGNRTPSHGRALTMGVAG